MSILGQEVVSLHFCLGCACAVDTADDEHTVTGGSSHDFERDTTPLNPTDHYGEWEDQKRFGFGVRS